MDNRRTFFKQLGALVGAAAVVPKALLPDERAIVPELFEKATEVPVPKGALIFGHLEINGVSYPVTYASIATQVQTIERRSRSRPYQLDMPGTPEYRVEVTIPGHHKKLMEAFASGTRIRWRFSDREGFVVGNAVYFGEALCERLSENVRTYSRDTDLTLRCVGEVFVTHA